jgi:hypothetical protein
VDLPARAPAFGFGEAVAGAGPRRDVVFAALRPGRAAAGLTGLAVEPAGVAIAPVTPRRTPSFVAPALDRGTGRPADLAACATVSTAARKAPVTPDVARSIALRVDAFDR